MPDAERVAAEHDYAEVVYAILGEANVGTHHHGASEIVARVPISITVKFVGTSITSV